MSAARVARPAAMGEWLGQAPTGRRFERKLIRRASS